MASANSPTNGTDFDESKGGNGLWSSWSMQQKVEENSKALDDLVGRMEQYGSAVHAMESKLTSLVNMVHSAYQSRRNSAPGRSISYDVNPDAGGEPEDIVGLETPGETGASIRAGPETRLLNANTVARANANEPGSDGAVMAIGEYKIQSVDEATLARRLDMVNRKFEKKSTKQEVIGNSPYVISPFHWLQTIWDVGMSILLFIVLITMPVALAFEQANDQMFWFNFVVDVLFLIDFVKNFFTGYVTDDDVVILSHKLVIKTYATGWAVPDFVSSFPIDALLKVIQDQPEAGASKQSDAGKLGKSAKIFKILRLVRLSKLFKLLRASRALRYLRYTRRILEDKLKIHIPDATSKIMTLVFAIMLVAHWLGCVNFMAVAMFAEESGEESITESWVYKAGLTTEQGAEPSKQYLFSLFKGLYQIIGGEEMLASGFTINCPALDSYCQLETWITLLSLYVGVIFGALIVGVFANILANMDQAGKNYENKVSQVNEYMRSKSLPAELRYNVRDYYLIRFKEGKMFNEEEIMKDLSPALRKSILQWNANVLIESVPLLRSVKESTGLISSLVSNFAPEVFFEKDVIFEEDTTGDRMFFVHTGMVEIMSKHYAPEAKASSIGKLGGVVNAIMDGCYFGDVALLLKDASGRFYRRTASCRAKVLCILYAMSRDHLQATIQDYPEMSGYMTRVAQARLVRMLLLDAKKRCSKERFEVDQQNVLVDEEDAKTDMIKMLNDEMEKELAAEHLPQGAAKEHANGDGEQHQAKGWTGSG